MAVSQMPSAQSRTSLVEKKMLFSRIRNLESLPLPSYSMLELSGILKSDEAVISDIASCVNHDHVMLALVMRLFFKTYPGTPAPDNLETLIEMIPGDQLKTLLYIPRMLDSFEYTEEVEWNHSYSVRILMESILDDNEMHNPDLVLATHLHDIGKNVFRDWSPKKYKLVETHVESSHSIPLYKMENAVLQMNHAEVGAELLKAWGFPESVWAVVANHHSDEIPEKYIFETALLQFANWIDCRARGIECDAPSKNLLLAGGIAEIDSEGYTDAQKRLINNLKTGNAGSIRKNMLNELLAAEQAARTAEVSINDDGSVTVQQPAAALEPAAAEAPAIEEEEEKEVDVEALLAASSNVAASASMAKREEELLKKMGLK